MKPDTRLRIFVVGLPRSGTTLHQAMLTAHPQIVSFPESHIFSFMAHNRNERFYGALAPDGGSFADRQLRRARAWIAELRGKPHPLLKIRLEEFLVRTKLEAEARRFLDVPFSIRPMSHAFTGLLDHAAGKHHWVEKTPNHVFFIRLIERHVPNAQFIHILRNGEDVLASIMDAAQKYPSWGAKYIDGAHTIPRLIALYNRATKASLANLGRANHLILSYEQTLADPQAQALRITTFLGLPASDQMVQIETSSITVNDEEPWKNNMGSQIKARKSKFETVFSPEEQRIIRAGARLASIRHFWNSG